MICSVTSAWTLLKKEKAAEEICSRRCVVLGRYALNTRKAMSQLGAVSCELSAMCDRKRDVYESAAFYKVTAGTPRQILPYTLCHPARKHDPSWRRSGLY